ncbi:MAG: hypothetical protein M3154_02740 [Candidatus Eremiobacteraeota bacterium]|nr:hypothetical protein [Candidatus Eremiobacteraeota bacterium]
MTFPDLAPLHRSVSTDVLVTRAFEDAGAVSPATARELPEIGVGADAVLPLVARHVVREGLPGRYYLHTGTDHARRAYLVRLIVIAVLLLLPVLFLQLSGR